MNPTVTIADIAKKAEVSTATVDRVINQRPGVNRETIRRVMDAMVALGASEPLKGRPKKSENYHFAYILPAARTPFFDLVDRIIAKSASEFRHSHITEVTQRLDASDPGEFAKELAKFDTYDGIALLAPDLPHVKLAVNELVRAGVHVVTLLSDIGGSMREALISADNRAAGRTAGLLLGRLAGSSRSGRVILASNSSRFSSVIDRRVGFAQIMEEAFPKITVVRLADLPESEDEAYAECRRVLAGLGDTSDLIGMYNVGDGTYGLVKAVGEAKLGLGFGLLAHDLTETNRSLLVSGGLSYLLHQDIQYCVLNAAKVLRSLCEHMRGALSVVQPRVEILTSENLF